MSMKLYAKSYDEQNGTEENILLLSHLKHSFWAAEAILNCTALEQLNLLGIDESQYERFRRIVLLAAAIHDLGKANSLFQAVLRGENRSQSIRHEWILFLLLRFSPLGTWIRSALECDVDFTILVWAIAGHHRKDKGDITFSLGKEMTILFGNDDFRMCLDWIAEEFQLDSPPELNPEQIEDKNTRQILEELLTDLANAGDYIEYSLNSNNRFEEDGDIADNWSKEEPCDRLLMAAVRSILMEADAVASALADPHICTEGKGLTRNEIQTWVKNSLGYLPLPAQYRKIVTQRQQQIASISIPGPKNEKLDLEREAFQHKVAQTKNRVTLVTAGCGSGKTLAAFLWAQENARSCGNRLFFGYPTTGTATEGFLDYLFCDETSLGDLIHSRVAVDFLLNERMKKAAINSQEEDHRAEVIKSLRLWSTGIVCCTVDTMLGFLVNMYSGHLAWSALTQSIFVFDEIHSYDKTLFDNLIKFLQIARGVPILLMTASLPEERLHRLKDVIAQHGEELGVIDGPKEWEQIKRYQRFLPEDNTETAAVDEAIARYKQGEKVLWICNTVSRAIQTAEKITECCGQYRPIVYHSYFRYEDRVKRHTECVEAFRKNEGVICITTQVAEMSLDISADFLLMDLAPVSAMIQRLGRLNRRAIFDGTKLFWVIFPQKNNGEPIFWPYIEHNGDKDLLWYEESLKWLDLFGEKTLSQFDLTELWAAIKMDKPLDESEIPPWLSPGPFMNHASLRAPSSGCEVILSSDLDKIKHGGTLDYLRCVIPMSQPYDKKNRLDKVPKYGCCIVENGTKIDYDAELGGRWKNDKKTPDGIKEILIF